MKTLRIAENLTLPIEAVTQTIAIVAKRRAGKSYTMRRLVEQLFKTGQQVVVVDPKGDQWGIRSSADAKGPGLPMVILGGERADVPLDVAAGEMVAKLVVDERVSALLDLSLFRKKEVARFMTDFLENLYRLKAREAHRTPLMLVLDEADAIAPQKPQDGEERMLGAAEDIVRRGGQRGLGCVLVTQRTAVLNKNVLTQAEILVALRTIAPQDLAAMNAWIDVHGTPDQKRTLMESLPSLPVGDAWFWSPGWPTSDGIFKRVHVLPIETFDSGATPKPGEKRREPKTLADVDLDAVKAQMAETIARAKAGDPKELRRQIAEQTAAIGKLTRELEQAKAKPAAAVSRDVEVLTDADREFLKALRLSFEEDQSSLADKTDLLLKGVADRAKDVIDRALADCLAIAEKGRATFIDRLEKVRVGRILEKLDHVGAAVPMHFTKQPRPATTVTNPPESPAKPNSGVGQSARPAVTPSPAGALSAGMQRILDTLAMLEVRQVPRSLDSLTSWMDLHPNGGTFRGNLAALRNGGYLEDVELTASGRAAARQIATGFEAAKAATSGGQLTILETLASQARALSIEELGQLLNLHPNGGTFRGNLARIRKMGLITSGQIRITEAAYR